VSGSKRDGTRVRQNYASNQAAKAEKANLEIEYLTGETAAVVRETRLTESQLRLAEVAFDRLSAEVELLPAVDYWLKHGRQSAVKESPRLDEAFEQFKAWLPQSGTRKCSQDNLRRRVNIFANAVPNLRISDITPDIIQSYLDKRAVSPKSKDNDRRAVSCFFSWCLERSRRWTAINPCREIRVPQDEAAPPVTLTVAECKGLLRKSEAYKAGQLAPYVAVCLFGGLRPFEAARLKWEQVNLDDGEIRMEANQTKTGRLRVVSICPTMRAWLKAYKGKAFFPSNRRRDFAALIEAIGYGTATEKKPKLRPWPVDAMRHTAISHFFRRTGSYGLTAEQFGNSEAIIKRFYQGRVSSEDTKHFYAILPTK
jgi:integrase